MSAYRLPIAGTRPDIAVRKLLQLGGRADLSDWLTAMDWNGSVSSFERNIINSLTRSHVVRIEANVYVVTQRGIDYAGPVVGAATSRAGQVAGPRYAPSKAPLSARHMARAGLVREGALEYAQIPSRYGSQRVAHKAKVRTA